MPIGSSHSSAAHLEVEHLGALTAVTFLDRSLLDRQLVRAAADQFSVTPSAGEKGQLLLNFALVEDFSSEALSELIVSHKKLEAAGNELLLCNLRPLLRDIFRETLLEKVFHIYADGSLRLEEKHATASSKTGGGVGRRMAVAVADHDRARAARIAEVLPISLQVEYFTDLVALGEFCRTQSPAAVLLPLLWPIDSEASGQTDAPVLEFLRTFRERTAVFVYAPTHALSIEEYCRALAAGAKQLFNVEVGDFLKEVRQAIARLVQTYHATQSEQEELSALFAAHGMIGDSAAMLEVYRRALKASQFHDLPVLIQGETGTGKQRLAEVIHRLDPKRSKFPLLTLNCSAINKTLAESELFGHTKGAFTGAQSDRPGIFQMADGGTLLLDEIGELDLQLQPKLLRVLQEQRLLPVGADYERSVNVRIIAATNRPLQDMIAQGQFREDLYQRLNVFRIYIPPLRERASCIEVQARHFLKIYQIGRDQKVTDFGLRVLEALRLLPWEGNTRQLENFIRETLAHKEHGTLLQMEDLPHWVLETLTRLRPRAPEVDSRETLIQKVYEHKMTFAQAMHEFERRLLQLVLERNGGNRTLTAAELNITPRSVHNKIKKFGLE